ncbi:serine incorporator/TMS membrane protein [Catenaria anguillulae PL171]|uniref:Serine incorporator/TMS membrane protein n=1 Tax=Catenaria anguillulae PL171 TaxID=765915 RepID=A0A1Y2I6G7_9FUNG|nr:serine incorporator/TMS membrane protein [Catenaria anguillulae PL171]
MSDVVGKKLADVTHGYLQLNCSDGGCYGVLAVHRVCFALTLFHAVMAVLLIGVETSKDRRAGWQNGFWGPKIILWLGVVVASFFIPNEFFIGYGNYVALVGAGIFVLLQLVLLIEFAHTFSERLIENYETTESRSSMVALIAMTVGLLLVGITLTGVMYGFFAGSGCKLNQFFITFNLLLCLGACLLSIAPAIQESNPRSGLAQVSIVVAYATYLVLSAVANEPVANDDEAQCNPVGAGKGSRTVSVAVGAIFTFLAILYSTTTVAMQGRRVLGHDVDPDAEEASVPLLAATASEAGVAARPAIDPALQAAVDSGALPASALESAMAARAAAQPTGAAGGNNNTTVVVVHAGPSDQYPTEDEAQGTAYNYAFFHVVFALAAMYLAMLVTSWNTVSVIARAPASGDGDGLLVEIGKSWGAVWVKIVSGWLVIGLYVWTLLGPVVLTDREWS